jgi:triosephosphate isomerase
MRTKIVAGNWKMNNDKNEGKALIKDLKKALKNEPLENTRVIVAPTFVNLSSYRRDFCSDVKSNRNKNSYSRTFRKKNLF